MLTEEALRLGYEVWGMLTCARLQAQSVASVRIGMQRAHIHTNTKHVKHKPI